MRRVPRSTVWLLWLLLALLPLRGVAQGLMGQLDLPAAPVAEAGCHGSAGHHGAPVGGDSSASPCQVCDLCHAGLGPWTGSLPAAAELPQTAPKAAPQAATRVRDGESLFRPPRR